MKHVIYAENSLLMGDEVVELMMEYAVLLANQGTADAVDVNAIGTNGDAVIATFLIGPATIMVAETSRSVQEEPENAAAVSYLQGKIGLIKEPPQAHGLEGDMGLLGFDEDV